MISDKFRLDGKVALVTGANDGIGQAIAVGLAEAGADIAAVHRSDITATREKVEALGRSFCAVRADMTRMESVQAVMDGVLATYDRIDILVNNAGQIRRDDVLDFSEEDWDAVMNINLKVLFFLTQAVGKRMIAQQIPGKIINIASLLSFQGGIRVPSYTASKSGVKGLTMLLANEWAKHGINVNAIAPGYIATKITAALRSDEARGKEILDRIPAGRWGDPADFQGAAVYLASAASDYVNGHTLVVDGGWLGR